MSYTLKNLVSLILIFVLSGLFFLSCGNKNTQKEQAENASLKPGNIAAKNEAHQLIIDMVETAGGREILFNLKDVEFTYVYHDLNKDKTDITTERYIFEQELSWGKLVKCLQKFPVDQKQIPNHYKSPFSLVVYNILPSDE